MTNQDIDNLVVYLTENMNIKDVAYFISGMKTMIINHPQGAELLDIFEQAGITITGIPCKRHPEA